jgi:hypothetical protein
VIDAFETAAKLHRAADLLEQAAALLVTGGADDGMADKIADAVEQQHVAINAMLAGHRAPGIAQRRAPVARPSALRLVEEPAPVGTA